MDNLSDIHTTTTTDTIKENSGSLTNTFDAGAVQKELDVQVRVTQTFDTNRQEVKAEINSIIDEANRVLENDPNNQEAQKTVSDMQNLGILVDSIAGALYSPSDSAAGAAANTLSPAIVYEIGQHFKENEELNKLDNGNRPGEGSAQHILAQTLVAAATASLADNDALSAGLSAGGAEVIAPMLADWMYDKNPQDLTSEEKNTISAIISLGSAAVGATTGNTTDVASSSVAGTTAVEDNAFYLYNNKVVATDKINDNKVVDLTYMELLKLGLLYGYEYSDSLKIISQQNLSSFENVYDLTNPAQFNELRTLYTGLYYNNINGNAGQVFMNGMNNSLAAAYDSVALIQNDFGATGLISNTTDRTFGVLGDAYEWVPNYLTTKDILNEYMLSQLSYGTEVITHSAANEDIFKAYKVASYINEALPLNIISVGSPRSITDLQNIGYPNGMLSIYQYNNPHDPVANGWLNGNANYEPNTWNIIDDLGNYHSFKYYYPTVKQQLNKAK